MENKVTMDRLSKELHISKTTISRALNHCPGINESKKRLVREAAARYGYTPERPAQEVAVVLPSVPDAFWGRFRRILGEESKKNLCRTRFFVYTSMYDKEDALQCVRRAAESGASVLLAALPDSEELRTYLGTVAENCFLLLLSEYVPVKNAFYVGCDSESEAYALAVRYMRENPEKSSFALLGSVGSETEKLRIRGFSRAVKEKNGKIAAYLEGRSTTRARAAALARRLSVLPTLPDCIFCPSGHAADAALAVQKLKTDKEIHCIGFDTLSTPYTDKGANDFSVSQNLRKQGKIAFGYVKRYLEDFRFPERKYIYIT